MRNPARLDAFYETLKDFHKRYIPDWRFGQFMINFLGWVQGRHGIDPFFPEEDRMLELLREYKEAELGIRD